MFKVIQPKFITEKYLVITKEDIVTLQWRNLVNKVNIKIKDVYLNPWSK